MQGRRERFEYNNLMYLAAGEVVSAVTGIARADFVRQRLLEPLGMASTVTDLKSLRNSDNLASGHGRNGAGGMVQVLPLMDFSNVVSAGAILSNASDMAHWVRFQLGNRTYEGRKIVEAQPYLSLDDAYKLDAVRDALRAGDVKRASRLANRVYRLTPVEA